MTKRQLRKRMWKDKDMGDLARDVDDALADIPFLKLKKFEAPYTEPFYVAADKEPEILIMGRIRNITDLAQQPVLTGALCHFQWDGARKRCVINSIDGMTATSGVLYRFTFLMVG